MRSSDANFRAQTSDVALNPTYTPTYPQEYASPAETLEICPSQANLGWDLNDTLQGVEKQKDFAHSGPSQVERPGLGEHSTESIVAGVGIPQDLDNTLRLPPECPLVPSLPPEYQNRQPDAGVRSDCTYAQALRDSCPAEAYSHHTVTPDIASFPQYPANTPSATRYGLTRPHHAVRGGHLIKCEPGLRLSDATTKDVGLDSKLCMIFGTTNVSTGPEDSSARPVIKPFTISRTYDDIGKSTIKIPSRSITAHLRHASIIVKALIEMIT
ncbi:hypothetical protein KC360_g2938 [Hortaea werneckii]|nr:hypothetical protein KC344_g2645 [Hortaea werneckii]KAI7176532.1 hypothetical protein KC360_g2938 [Hortaea werneckii]